MDDRRRDSLVPPDPYAGRRQSGPMRLMVLGLAISGAAYLLRGRLAPAPRAAEAVAFQPPATQPIVSRPLRARPAPVDAFFPSIGGPDESAVDPFAATAKAAEPSPLRLQSIVIGPRRRVCMINDKPSVVGDVVDGALIRAIGRESVTVRRANRDVVIKLPIAQP